MNTAKRAILFEMSDRRHALDAVYDAKLQALPGYSFDCYERDESPEALAIVAEWNAAIEALNAETDARLAAL